MARQNIEEILEKKVSKLREGEKPRKMSCSDPERASAI